MEDELKARIDSYRAMSQSTSDSHTKQRLEREVEKLERSLRKEVSQANSIKQFIRD